MRSLIFLAVAIAVALADDSLIRKRRGATGGYGFSLAQARIDGQDMRIQQLNNELEELESQVAQGNDDVPASMVILSKRMDRIQGSQCQERDIGCGRHSGQCISELLFCDGVNDCINSFDETEDNCKNRVPAGRSWSGIAHWENCLVRADNDMTILITGNRRDDLLPSRMFIDAVIIENYSVHGEQKHKTWQAEGQYRFSDRSITLAPPEESTARIGTHCVDGGPGVAQCEFIRESDGTVCGSATLSRDV